MASVVSTIGRTTAAWLALLADTAVGQTAVPAGRAPLPAAVGTAFERGDARRALAGTEEALSRCLAEPGRPQRCIDLLLAAASLSVQTGRLVRAEDHLRRATALVGDVPAHDPTRLTTIDIAAFILEARRHGAAAERLYRQTLELRRRHLGECHGNTGSNYDNLGMNLHGRGQVEAAARYLLLGLASRRCALGEANMDTAQSYNNVAFSLGARGANGALVEDYLRRAIASGAAAGQSVSHPAQAQRVFALAFLLQHAGGRPGESYVLYATSLPTAIGRFAPELRPDADDLLDLVRLRPHFLAQIRGAWMVATPRGKGRPGR